MASGKRAPTTIYLDPKVARAAKVKAALTDKSLSDVVNDAVVRYLSKDESDLRAFRERANEPEYAFEEILRELKRDGLL